MADIQALPNPEIPRQRRQIIESYFEQYLPFLAESFEGQERVDLDRALFAYGRFLSSEFCQR